MGRGQKLGQRSGGLDHGNDVRGRVGGLRHSRDRAWAAPLSPGGSGRIL